MLFRREYLREGATFTRNATWREDLPNEGMLSGILLRMSVAGVSGAFAEIDKWRIIDYISKIEVIGNGSVVIKSFTGQVAAALTFFDQGVANPDYWHSYATGTKWCHVLLTFGRYLGDPLIGLDLSKWDNVELQLTNDATSSQFGADISLSVLQFFIHDAAPGSFAGYLRTEDWRNWTTVADETKYLDLPTDHALRRVVMQLWPDQDANNISETGMWNLADDVELTLKSGVVRLFKGGIDDIMWENFFHFGKEVLSTANLYMTADYGRRVGIGYVLGAVPGAGSQDGAVATAVPTIEGRRTDNTQKPENFEADTLISTINRGLCPENCVVVPFNMPDDPAAYLDLAAAKTVALNIHTRNAASAADGTNRVILDRLVRV